MCKHISKPLKFATSNINAWMTPSGQIYRNMAFYAIHFYLLRVFLSLDHCREIFIKLFLIYLYQLSFMALYTNASRKCYLRNDKIVSRKHWQIYIWQMKLHVPSDEHSRNEKCHASMNFILYLKCINITIQEQMK